MISYVDTSKVCVWGWSFGGYLTGLLLAEVRIFSRDPCSIFFSGRSLVRDEISLFKIVLLQDGFKFAFLKTVSNLLFENIFTTVLNLLFQDGRQFENIFWKYLLRAVLNLLFFRTVASLRWVRKGVFTVGLQLHQSPSGISMVSEKKTNKILTYQTIFVSILKISTPPGILVCPFVSKIWRDGTLDLVALMLTTANSG